MLTHVRSRCSAYLRSFVRLTSNCLCTLWKLSWRYIEFYLVQFVFNQRKNREKLRFHLYTYISIRKVSWETSSTPSWTMWMKGCKVRLTVARFAVAAESSLPKKCHCAFLLSREFRGKIQNTVHELKDIHKEERRKNSWTSLLEKLANNLVSYHCTNTLGRQCC